MGRASLKRYLLAVQTQIVGVQTVLPSYRPRGVDTPKTNGVVRRVVEKPRLIEIRPHGKSVNLPGIDLAFDHKAVKAEPNIWTFANIDQAPRAIFQFVPSGSELDPAVFIPCSDFEKCCLEIELFFVDRPRTTDAVRVQTALELDQGANVLAVMNVEIKHVPFIEAGVHERLLAPVVVSDLFPNLASFAAHR